MCSFDIAQGSACEDGLCVPSNDVSGMFSGVCNLLPNGSTCLLGWDQMEVVYRSFSDSRVCTCVCGDPSGGACNGAKITLYDTNDCSGAEAAVVVAGAGCANTAALNATTAFKFFAGTWAPGACAPMAAKEGEALFMDPMVLCCLP